MKRLFALLITVMLALVTLQPAVRASAEEELPENVVEITETAGEEAVEQTAEEESLGVQARINNFVGEKLVGPMWSYFLGFPIPTTKAYGVLHGEDDYSEVAEALRKADITVYEDKDDLNENAKYLLVEKADIEAAGTVIRAAGFEPASGEHTAWVAGIPFIVLVLVAGGLIFTLRFGFVNVRMFRHSIDVIRGKYDKPHDPGQISHFQALTSALSATVGLGNIAGVAVAIGLGGAGAVFWMWVIAFFGMSLKFASCSFAQIYRRVGPDGHVLGGPMVYLEEGIKELFPKFTWLGRILGLLFAILTVFAAFGGGNMFQANQTYSLINQQFLNEQGSIVAALIVGVTMAFLVGVVIIGGIKRIGEVTSKVVPFMCGFYCLVCFIIILMNAGEVPGMIGAIFGKAMSGEAIFGGAIGVFIQGAKRAAFSNEAGLGSAAIAHSAAKTDEPVREGMVAMIGPFIDTIIVCTMTALAILITGAHLDPATGAPFESPQGVKITAAAFGSLGGAVPIILTLAVAIFAYSTLISWSYYGERAVEYLFGMKGVMPYRLVYVFVVIAGPVLSLQNVIDFADLMLLSMAFPNIIGMLLLSGKLSPMVKDYIRRLKSGEMKPVK